MRPPTVVVIGIDPGRTPGIVAVKIRGARADEVGRPDFRPLILGAWATEGAPVMADPTAIGEVIAVEVLRLAHFHESTLIGIEIPKGMLRANVSTYGAQRETIGSIRGYLRAHHIQLQVVAPNSGKMSLCDNRYASKREMIEAMKGFRDFVKAWDPVTARLEAKADALGVALAAAGWRQPKVAA